MVGNRLLVQALVVLLVAVAAACGRTGDDEGRSAESARSAEPAPAKERDIHSFARPDEARVTHVALDLVADFTAKTLGGRTTLSLQRAANARELVLDTRDLTIQGATAP